MNSKTLGPAIRCSILVAALGLGASAGANVQGDGGQEEKCIITVQPRLSDENTSDFTYVRNLHVQNWDFGILKIKAVGDCVGVKIQGAENNPTGDYFELQKNHSQIEIHNNVEPAH